MSQAYKYTSGADLLTTLADLGDWGQLRNGASCIVEVLEIQVFQVIETTLDMNGIRLVVGTVGSGGTDESNDKYQTDGPAAIADFFTLPTVDVSTPILELFQGWNILQPFVWLPTPETQLILSPSQALGIRPVKADAITSGVGINIIWQEYR